MTDEPQAQQAPVLRVINPNATPEEIAALIAIFSAVGGGEPEAEQIPSGWSAPGNMHRAPMPAPGPGQWVALGRR